MLAFYCLWLCMIALAIRVDRVVSAHQQTNLNLLLYKAEQTRSSE